MKLVLIPEMNIWLNLDHITTVQEHLGGPRIYYNTGGREDFIDTPVKSGSLTLQQLVDYLNQHAQRGITP